MIALVLASLLVLGSSPASVAGAPANPRAQKASAADAPTAPPISSDAVVIRNSGSTNTLGYTIAVSPDGGTLVAQDGAAVQKKLSADKTRELFDDVRALMPIAPGSTRPCMRSVSFGSSTTVSYANATTPDLSCRADAASAQLRRTIASIVQALGITTLPRQRLQE